MHSFNTRYDITASQFQVHLSFHQSIHPYTHTRRKYRLTAVPVSEKCEQIRRTIATSIESLWNECTFRTHARRAPHARVSRRKTEIIYMIHPYNILIKAIRWAFVYAKRYKQSTSHRSVFIRILSNAIVQCGASSVYCNKFVITLNSFEMVHLELHRISTMNYIKVRSICDWCDGTHTHPNSPKRKTICQWAVVQSSLSLDIGSNVQAIFGLFKR